MEGFDRQRQYDGRQSDRAGAEHCGSDYRYCQRRLVEKDHGRCQGRDPRDEEYDQYVGGSARRVCLGSDACGARGGIGRNSRRPGGGAGCFRNVERLDRLSQLHGGQSHCASAKHCPCYDGGGDRRFVQEDHCRCSRRNPRVKEHH